MEKVQELRAKRAQKQDEFTAQLDALKVGRSTAVDSLKIERNGKVDAFSALAEKMSADNYVEDPANQKAYDSLKAEIADADQKIKAAETDHDQKIKAVEDAAKADAGGWDVRIQRIEDANRVKGSRAVIVPGQHQERVVATPKVRYGKLKAFHGDNAEDNAYRSGMFLLASLFGREKAAAWCAENGIVVKAQGEGVNTAGGFLVPIEFEQAIIDLRETYGTFRGQCRMMPMGSDSMSVPRRASGLTAYFVGENTQMTESQKGWDQVMLVAKKLACLTRYSTELDEDAVINIADDLASEMAYAFAQTEDSSGWNGDGTSTYGGIVGARTKIIDGTHTKSAVNAATGHDLFAEIDATDLATVMGSLPRYAERNAKWYASQVAWATVFQRLIASAGGVTISELTGGKPTRRYLGYEVVIDQTLPTVTSTLVNVAMLFFGDLSLACMMGERRGIRVKMSDDRYFEFDQIGLQATERVDINVHSLGDNTNAGPLIALIGA